MADQSAEQRLLAAAGEGDEATVRQLLEGAEDIAKYQEEEEGASALILAAKQGHASIVKLLLEAGAPWNALDRRGNCAGDYAMNEGHQEAYEVLLNAAVQAELVLGALQRRARSGAEASNSGYLQERVKYDDDKLLDAESNGVMMEWERPLMESHAQAVCFSGGDVLNVGFGMGLVDTAIQKRNPKSHTIIEAHPGVYEKMLKDGWDKKPGVRICFGRWQDVLPQLGRFDGIFFDTFGEYYDDLREFHAHLPKLLRPGGIYSFFNGLCADNAFFHVVCCQLVQLEMARLGFETTFVPLPVNSAVGDEVWEGVKLKYWQLDAYFLPVCQYEDNDVEGKSSQQT
ncbi:ankyrin repeat family protein [Klebsormidium nitens]|uniref:Protein arginine N-methyltransferase 2 n=1 Tax=Klebsormidium nitens TaxID=105231 RepID=A0A1Y1HT87_KLENI|nr:ankyrin repeat family protein [Klebsormidium nitens]|eukprot:GAQ80409.1 ankyrin repeat family protein [Klebsormidium nitens]